MARAIRVIAFAIAAYASKASRRGATGRDGDVSRMFGRVWRNLPASGAEVMVKIGVISEAGEPIPVDACVQDGVEDVWLRSVVETPDGFCGSVAIASQRLRASVGVQPLRFQLAHVRNWRIKSSARLPDAPPAGGGAGREAGADHS